jgi:hypothetical protein
MTNIEVSELEVRFGILYPSLEIQLKGYGLDKAFTIKCESQRKAINLLVFGGLISSSQADKCFSRLFKNIMKAIK